MSYRHITADSAYQAGDQTIIVTAPTENLTYILPGTPCKGTRVEVFNTITANEYPIYVDGNGHDVDSAEDGGTQQGLVINGGRGVTFVYCEEVTKWCAIARS